MRAKNPTIAPISGLDSLLISTLGRIFNNTKPKMIWNTTNIINNDVILKTNPLTNKSPHTLPKSSSPIQSR